MDKLTPDELKVFLDEKYLQYNQPDFIDSDPIQVPHGFVQKVDIEIVAFLAATIAWGQRPTIIKNAYRLAELMRNQPYDFVMQADFEDHEGLQSFKHRTFNGHDLIFFLKALRHLYREHGGLEPVFADGYSRTGSVVGALAHFRQLFFEVPHLARTEKHVSNVLKKASCKRLNMFLMWMVRHDARGVHFGLWDKIPSAALMLPLDVHCGNVGRKLGLLTRKQNDWKAVEEITGRLREFDPDDPVKYDFALFGLGVFEGF